MDDSPDSNRLIGIKIIESAIALDDALVEILIKESKILKVGTKNGISPEDLSRINTLIRNIIMVLTLTDDRIKTGINLYFGSNN